MASSHQAYLAHAHALSHAQQLPSASAAYMTPHAHQHLPSMTSTAMASRAQLTGAPPPPPASTPTSTSARPAGKQLTQQQLAQQQRNLTPWSKVDKKGWQYALDVVQQPQRARMCGFGDKDRRPITPPPCVRLVIRDHASGKEIDVNEIEHNMYILNVDLWSEDALREVNLVRSTTATPSISSTQPVSFQAVDQPPPPSSSSSSSAAPPCTHILPGGARPDGYAPAYPPQPPHQHHQHQQRHHHHQHAAYASYGPPVQYYPNHHHDPYGSGGGPSPTGYVDAGGAYLAGGGGHARLSIPGGQPQGMFTRNLIGSLAASAFRLADTGDKIGIWFVLQDLSVRTEGHFRLRFSFVDVSANTQLLLQNSSSSRSSSSSSGTGTGTSTSTISKGGGGFNGEVGGSNGNGHGAVNRQVNTESAPVLASVFSDVFQVYSAKKFPGVCESTPLSKCFATQGIKIPIRKDNQSSRGAGPDDDDYD